MAYFRQKGTTNIVDDAGVVVRDPAKTQEALKGYGYNLDQVPEYSGATPISDPAGQSAPINDRYTPDGKLNRSKLTPQNDVADYFENLDRTPYSKEEEAAIREETRRNMQAQIDSINNVYSGILTQAKEQGVDRLGQTRSVNARSGTLGQDFGNANMDKTKQYNTQIETQIENERLAKVNAVLQQIEDRASDKIEKERTRTEANAKDYINYLANVQAEAKNNITTLAKSGITLEQLSDDQYKKLLDQTGWDNLTLEMTYNANKPKEAQIDYKFEKLGNGKYLFFGVDPKTGELVRKEFDYDVPPEYDLTIAQDGTPIIFNPTTGQAQIAPGMKQRQFLKPESSGGGGGTLTERDRLALGPVFQQAADKLNANRGGDTKVDPNVYSQVRETFAANYPDKVKLFDYAFSGKLSETERKNLGLDKGDIDFIAQILGQ